MAIKFTDEKSLPVAQKDNEFREVVAWLAANVGQVKSYVVKGETAEAADKQVAADKRLMAEAGNELASPVTVNSRQEKSDDGKTVKVYIWTNGKKIIRKRASTTA